MSDELELYSEVAELRAAAVAVERAVHAAEERTERRLDGLDDSVEKHEHDIDKIHAAIDKLKGATIAWALLRVAGVGAGAAAVGILAEVFV
jgi:hypothetical protein